jgi:hypothetical protein
LCLSHTSSFRPCSIPSAKELSGISTNIQTKKARKMKINEGINEKGTEKGKNIRKNGILC